MADISVSNLHKEFGLGADKVIALENVNLEISGHAFVSIVGASGCGKSTLLNILSGIDTPTSGRVSITQNGKAARAGYVFQAARLLPWRSVMDNMLFVQTDKSEETRARCQHYLEMVQLGDKGNKYPGELSGGMQQRVGIARAFDRTRRVVHGRAVQPPGRDHRPHPAGRAAQHLERDRQDRGVRDARRRRGGGAVQPDPGVRQGRSTGRRHHGAAAVPRDVSDADVAVTKAEVFKTFEDIGALAVS